MASLPAPRPASLPDHAAAPDPLLTLEVPAGGRVLVASDLHLGALADATSDAATTDLARRLEAWTGPGLVVLAGDTFELWAEPNNSPAKALRSHPRFAAALAAFATATGREVVVLAGNHDGALGWCPTVAGEVRRALGARVALALDLELITGAGTRRVRVEHGHQLDPANAFLDPTRPGDRPLGQHVVTQLLPAVVASGGAQGWLADAGGIADPADFPRYVASRLAYRRLARHLWWLLLPVALVAAARLGTHLSGRVGVSPVLRTSRLVPLVALGMIGDLALVAIAVVTAGRRVVKAISSVDVPGAGPHGDRNAAARARAVALGHGGWAGYLTGHSHQPELVDLDGTFYGNPGCNAEVLEELPARGNLPSVFRSARRTGWLELEAGAELHVSLWLAQAAPAPVTLPERLATFRFRRGPRTALPVRPAQVASLARRSAWPAPTVQDAGRRTRRFAAAAITAIGLVDIVSSITPPLAARARGLLHLVPYALPETAAFASASLGVGLVLLAGGVRRGQRRAWAIAVALLVGSMIANVAKGLDVEEAAMALGVAGYLVGQRASFRGRANGGSARHAATVLAGTALGALGAAAVVSLVSGASWFALLGSSGARLFGLPVSPLPGRLRFVGPALAAMVVVSLGGTLWLLLRPRLPAVSSDAEGDARAWSLVRRHGRGTLDYFALRDDKARFVNRNTVVAYAVRGGVAVVAPDPVGPADERAAAWSAFRRHAADNCWSIVVLGAGAEWLPTYQAAGMTAIYAGDEAVVDLRRFSLDGGRNKTLRQAANRLANAGYHVSFHDPSALDEARAEELRAMVGDSRQGDVERGFSMTLSRLFDPRDTDLLLAVAVGPDGRAAAFCQFVPAAGIDGYSLDLMRRSNGAHPNGLTDFVVISTIEELRARGRSGLGLNFATMRAVLAGDVDDTWLNRRQRAVLRRLGEDMQIETLWRFNAKYDPDWLPRYVVIDGPDQILSAGLAVAAAESLWELPLVGRYLRPAARPSVHPSAGS